MIHQSYSSILLNEVIELTDIKKNDWRCFDIVKVAYGTILKVAIAAFAAIECVIYIAALMAASPLYLLEEECMKKPFMEITEKTFSSINTIINSLVSIATIRAKEKNDTNEKDIGNSINYIVNFAEKFIKINMIVTVTLIAFVSVLSIFPAIEGSTSSIKMMQVVFVSLLTQSCQIAAQYIGKANSALRLPYITC